VLHEWTQIIRGMIQTHETEVLVKKSCSIDTFSSATRKFTAFRRQWSCSIRQTIRVSRMYSGKLAALCITHIHRTRRMLRIEFYAFLLKLTQVKWLKHSVVNCRGLYAGRYFSCPLTCNIFIPEKKQLLLLTYKLCCLQTYELFNLLTIFPWIY
jgi:hypothetical protein